MTINRLECLDVADRIGCILSRDALWDGDRCTWMGWSKENINQQWQNAYCSMSVDLYGGTSGIALFLAELYQLTNDAEQLRALEGAVAHALANLSRVPSGLESGFYTGYIGIAYALIRIGEILRRDYLLEVGSAMMDRLNGQAMDAQLVDVLSGSAGLIPILLLMAQRYDKPSLIGIAHTHGQNLIRRAVHVGEVCSWHTVDMAVFANLTGYSHGAAGISTALLELYGVTGDREYLDVALAGLRFEASVFNEKQKNWPDNRNMNSTDPNAKPGTSMAWCHGAPGIGLSRLRSSVLLPDHEGIRADLELALATTAASLSALWKPGNGNYSLCHGAAGNAELMLMAGQQLGRPELTRVAEKVGEEGIDFYVKQGLPWPCGNGGAGETPNLMLGTAGIGYFYLRLYDPVAVPSVLLISPDQSVS